MAHGLAGRVGGDGGGGVGEARAGRIEAVEGRAAGGLALEAAHEHVTHVAAHHDFVDGDVITGARVERGCGRVGVGRGVTGIACVGECGVSRVACVARRGIDPCIGGAKVVDRRRVGERVGATGAGGEAAKQGGKQMGGEACVA